MAKRRFLDLNLAEDLIRKFSLEDLIEAASFHGNIGESRAGLDSRASGEQAHVQSDHAALLKLGAEYLEKFGIKFLISAQGQTGSYLLEQLKARLANSAEQELEYAREALWQITRKRLAAEEDRSLTRCNRSPAPKA